MALVTEPVRVTDHRLICDRPGADRWDQGITSIARNYKATRFEVVVEKPGEEDFRARIDYREDCDPGTNESFYLAPGHYRTGLMNVAGGFYPYFRDRRDRRDPREIMMIVSDEISRQSRIAEKEHCMDGVRAYEITLKSAEDTIKKVRMILEADREKKYATRAEAFRAVGRMLVDESEHPRIGEIFRKAITSGGMSFGSFKTDIEALYFETARLTQERDTEGWHSFRFETSEYRPCFASCRGYQTDSYEYRKILMPLRIAQGEVSPSSHSVVRL